MISISFLRLFVENLLTVMIVSCESFAVSTERLELPKPFEICSVKRELMDKFHGSGTAWQVHGHMGEKLKTRH